MDVTISKSELKGSVKAPPSKSISHRAIIASSLSKGQSIIYNIAYSKDILATIDAMENFGVEFIKNDDLLVINSKELTIKESYFNCQESGSTLRFTIPIALSIGGEFIFDGYESLKKRPVNVYKSIYDKDDIFNEKLSNNHLPLLLRGKLLGDTYNIVGDVSSQFISGMIFGLANLKNINKKKIVISNKMESKAYIDLTIEVLKKYGVEVLNNNYESFEIVKDTFEACDFVVEGDFSQVAFFVLAGAIGEKVSVSNLNLKSIQGDREIINIAKKFGIRVEEKEDEYIFYKSNTYGINIDISEWPDLAPVIFALGVISEGETIVNGISRLRIKESDRVLSMVTELTKLGANICDCGEYVKIIGNGDRVLKGGVTIETWNDHRVAMTLSVLSTLCEEKVVIKDAECVEKSYKNFFNALKKLNCQLKISF
ncbi:MAG: 3-phosphoshikimate 1-carboxyvinyltransferase [Lachnospirales bacterium]